MTFSSAYRVRLLNIVSRSLCIAHRAQLLRTGLDWTVFSPPDVQQLIFDRREFQDRPLAIFFVHLLRYEVDDFTTSFWVFKRPL
jgi:hypothetical protein